MQLGVCRCNRTDWCLENEFATCSTPEDLADILDAVFHAAIKSGVNVQQYQWGQRNLTSTAHGPVRRQEGQNVLGSSPDDGYGS